MNIETLLLKNTMHTISKLFKIFFENIKTVFMGLNPLANYHFMGKVC